MCSINATAKICRRYNVAALRIVFLQSLNLEVRVSYDTVLK